MASTETPTMFTMLFDALKDARDELQEAREAIDGWAAYADDYFRGKHGIQDDLARVDAAIARIDAALAKAEGRS